MKSLGTSCARVWVVLVVGLVLVGCGRGSEAPVEGGGGGIGVVVSIVPQRYMVERIGGDWVRVQVMVGPGASPATYEPKPSQLRALSQARVYFSSGVPFEAGWMDRFRRSNSSMKVVDVNEGVERLWMLGHDHGHGHGDEEGVHHHHEATWDPHTWLSPRRVKVQAERIAEVLSELAPEGAPEFRANLDRLLSDIDALDAELRTQFEGLAGRRFLVFHPSWGYFADDYGLEQLSIEVGGQEPSAAEMAEVIRRARDGGVSAVFAQPEFRMQQAGQVADALGLELVVISPLEADWLENLRMVGARIAEAIREGTGDE